jgi:hypothetical protein
MRQSATGYRVQTSYSFRSVESTPHLIHAASCLRLSIGREVRSTGELRAVSGIDSPVAAGSKCGPASRLVGMTKFSFGESRGN